MLINASNLTLLSWEHDGYITDRTCLLKQTFFYISLQCISEVYLATSQHWLACSRLHARPYVFINQYFLVNGLVLDRHQANSLFKGRIKWFVAITETLNDTIYQRLHALLYTKSYRQSFLWPSHSKLLWVISYAPRCHVCFEVIFPKPWNPFHKDSLSS